MSKTSHPYDAAQMFLMPASMRDWLPSGHLAYLISDLAQLPQFHVQGVFSLNVPR